MFLFETTYNHVPHMFLKSHRFARSAKRFVHDPLNVEMLTMASFISTPTVAHRYPLALAELANFVIFAAYFLSMFIVILSVIFPLKMYADTNTTPLVYEAFRKRFQLARFRR